MQFSYKLLIKQLEFYDDFLGNVVENEICNQLLVLIERTFARRGYLSSKTLSLNELFGVENQKEHKKNYKPSEHQKCLSNFHKSDQNAENKKYQLPMAYYLWIPRPVGVTLGSIMLG